MTPVGGVTVKSILDLFKLVSWIKVDPNQNVLVLLGINTITFPSLSRKGASSRDYQKAVPLEYK